MTSIAATWAAGGLLAAALAADPVRGRNLYATPPQAGLLACAECHSDDPAVNNFGNIFVGRNAPGLIERAIGSNTGGMVVFSAYYGQSELADIAAYLGNSPSRLSFAEVAAGEAGAAQRVAVRASSKVGLSGIAARIEPAGEFRVLDGGCPSSIAARESCHFDVVFAPAAPGQRSARLLIAHGGSPTPVEIGLDGQATPRPSGIAVLRPQAVGFAEAAERRVVTVTNGAQGPLLLKSISVRPADFSIDGGSCHPGRSLAAGQSCSIALTFGPLAAGGRSGELKVEHDGIGTAAVVPLAGSVSALGLPRATADAGSLDFGVQLQGTAGPTRMVSVLNTGTDPLRWALVTTTGDAFRIVASSCAVAQDLAPGRRCQLAMAFQPPRAVLFSGELVLTPVGNSSALRIPLFGQGLAGGGRLAASLSRIAFRGQPGATSVVQQVHLVNQGTLALTVGPAVLSGAHPADFVHDPTSSCRAGALLPPGASCALALRFAPLAAGSRSAKVTVSQDDGMAPVTVDLHGGVATEPSPWLDVAVLDFRERAVGSTDEGDIRRVVIRNLAEVALPLRAMTATGDQAADFPFTPGCPVPGQLTPGAACELRLRFAPSSDGQRRASLVIDSGSGAAAMVSLSGIARAAPTPGLTLSALALDFGTQALASTPTLRRLHIANQGSAPVLVSGLSADPPFTLQQAQSCRRSLSPGESCSVEVSLAPAAPGRFDGRLSVQADDVTAPRLVTLSGRVAETAATLRWLGNAGLRWSAPVAIGQASEGQVLTLVNDGNTPATVALSTAGAAAMEFSLDPASTCLAVPLAPGGQCSASVRFHPAAAGPRSARLIATLDGHTQAEATLDAQGLAPAASRLDVGQAVVWAADPLRASMNHRLVVGNAGPGELAVGSLGMLSPEFTATAPAGAGCAMDGFVLLPGDSCGVDLGWTGSAQASSGGGLQIVGDDDTGQWVVPLSITEDPQLRSNVGAGGGAMGPEALLLLAVAVILLAWRRSPSD